MERLATPCDVKLGTREGFGIAQTRPLLGTYRDGPATHLAQVVRVQQLLRVVGLRHRLRMQGDDAHGLIGRAGKIGKARERSGGARNHRSQPMHSLVEGVRWVRPTSSARRCDALSQTFAVSEEEPRPVRHRG